MTEENEELKEILESPAIQIYKMYIEAADHEWHKLAPEFAKHEEMTLEQIAEMAFKIGYNSGVHHALRVEGKLE